MGNVASANISLKLNKLKYIKYFYDSVIEEINRGNKNFEIKIKDKDAFPNVCAPISGLIDYFKKKYGASFSINYKNEQSKASFSCIESPIVAEGGAATQNFSNPYGRVWMFSSPAGIGALVNSIVSFTRKSIVMSRGVINGLEWSLNEAMDNVLQHSVTKIGFIMVDFDEKKEKVMICVYDYGIGIYNSLIKSHSDIRTKSNAITLALKEQITRDKEIGQGNGLWGLSRIVEENSGLLQIISDGASYIKNSKNEIRTEDDKFCSISNTNGSTTIYFQLNFKNEINIATAIKSDCVVDLELEKLENEKGDIVITNFQDGTGTRAAADQMKNYILNIIFAEHKKVIFDFKNVSSISSSYADELFGKIISKYGIAFFMEKISIKNLSPTNMSILNRSITQRMAESFNNNKQNK